MQGDGFSTAGQSAEQYQLQPGLRGLNDVFCPRYMSVSRCPAVQAVVIGEFILVTQYLSIQFVNQAVNRSVHVVRGFSGIDGFAADTHVDRRFRLLLHCLHDQCRARGYRVVEMAGNFVQFLGDVGA